MDIFDTRTLLEVIRVQKPLQNYWLQYFPRVMTFDTQDIMFDQVVDMRHMAPFVAPNVGGQVMRDRGHTAKTFRPAYLQPMHTVTPDRAIPRMAGEALAGAMTLQQRMDAIVGENMRLEREAVERRLEWMAAKAIIDGAVTVSGENYPTVTVSFGRSNTLSDTKLLTERWSESTSTPLTDIDEMRTEAFRLARSSITRLTFGVDAWTYFARHASVVDLLKTDYRGSTTDYTRVLPDPGPFEFMGYLAGSRGVGTLELYRYHDEFDADDGTATAILDTNTVVGAGPGIQGIQCFGAIMDLDSMVATRMYPSMWVNKNPSVAYTKVQSAPLMVPAQPNASFKIKVY